MRIRKIAGENLRTLIVIALASLSCYAQSAGTDRDFSGTWVLNLAETRIDGKLPGDDEPQRNAEIWMDGPKVSIAMYQGDQKPADLVQRSIAYYTDGRGETNPRPGPRRTITQWKGNKLVIKVDQDESAGKHVEEWYLSKDRKKFFQKVTVTTRIDMQFNGRSVGVKESKFSWTYVFDRAPTQSSVKVVAPLDDKVIFATRPGY